MLGELTQRRAPSVTKADREDDAEINRSPSLVCDVQTEASDAFFGGLDVDLSIESIRNAPFRSKKIAG
jgi:hypothetical protein